MKKSAYIFGISCVILTHILTMCAIWRQRQVGILIREFSVTLEWLTSSDSRRRRRPVGWFFDLKKGLVLGELASRGKQSLSLFLKEKQGVTL